MTPTTALDQTEETADHRRRVVEALPCILDRHDPPSGKLHDAAMAKGKSNHKGDVSGSRI